MAVLDCQFHGSKLSSTFDLVRPDTSRSSTSVNRAIGSTPFSLAVYWAMVNGAAP